MKGGPFQTILLVIFAFVGLLGVLIFAGVIPIGNEKANYGGEVTLWGFLPNSEMSGTVIKFNEENKNKLSLVYEFKEEGTLENELIGALARGEGPDLIMFPQNLIIRQSDKLFPIPYGSYSERDFKDTFAEIGEMFLSKNGILALPLYVDPLVMYWNRDLFTSVGVVSYPKNWVEFLKLPNVLTKHDSRGNISQSLVSFGTFKNVSNAKEILSMLSLQTGDNIVERKFSTDGQREDSFKIIFDSPAESAFNFYIEFANQSKSSYSWNSSLPLSRKAFEAGTLAVYFGKASEYRDIKKNNPHLNFDVSIVPQRDDTNKKVTYGDMRGLAVLKSSKNLTTAITAVYYLSDENYGQEIARAAFLPSLRRDNLSKAETNPILSVFDKSAVISRAWFDPYPAETTNIFRDIVESVLAGKKSETTALGEARIRMLGYVK